MTTIQGLDSPTKSEEDEGMIDDEKFCFFGSLSFIFGFKEALWVKRKGKARQGIIVEKKSYQKLQVSFFHHPFFFNLKVNKINIKKTNHSRQLHSGYNPSFTSHHILCFPFLSHLFILFYSNHP